MIDRYTALNLTTAARLKGVSRMQASRAAKDGRLGPIVHDGREQLHARADVEQWVGRCVTDREIDVVMNKRRET